MWEFWDSFELGYSAHISINYFGDAQFGIPKLLQDWQTGWTHSVNLASFPGFASLHGFFTVNVHSHFQKELKASF